ncbi:ankyrin repeat domain-containing protein [Streptosporangium sp. KLBMP 9127]|nr:ankyrin repeat domain-containing protein [Streptosporangium sp. KLBMP 9127]
MPIHLLFGPVMRTAGSNEREATVPLRLPGDPSLEHLKNQAKRLKRQVHAADPAALDLVRDLHPGTRPAGPFTLADAQLVTARLYGFASWPRLRRHLDLVTELARAPHRVAESADPVAELLRLGCLTYGDPDLTRPGRAVALLAADPRLATADVFTMAACGRSAELAELLAADPAQARRQGGPYRWEPLLYLAYSRIGAGDPPETARLLLAHGADPNAGYLWEGLTPPFTALTGVFGRGERAEPEHPRGMELARLLLGAGADPNDSQTLYNRGLALDDTEHLELLFEFGLGTGDGGPWRERLGPAQPSPSQLLQDEVLAAALYGRPRRLRLLIEHGAVLDGHGTGHPIFEGRTAYELAVLRGHTEIADLLTAAGAGGSLDRVDLFLAACMRGERPADLDVADAAIARMPYMISIAAAAGKAGAVRVLASLGFDVSHVRRASALHEAALSGDLAMVRLLVGLGADPEVRDTEYEATPQGWAEHNGHDETAAYLAGLTAHGTMERG